MPNTQIQRWMLEPPLHTRQHTEKLIAHKGYSWTGYSGAGYGVQIVWELRIWNISTQQLLLIDILLAPYLLGDPHT